MQGTELGIFTYNEAHSSPVSFYHNQFSGEGDSGQTKGATIVPSSHWKWPKNLVISDFQAHEFPLLLGTILYKLCKVLRTVQLQK